MDFEARLKILIERQRRLNEAIAELRADVQATKPKSEQKPGVDVKQILQDLIRQNEEWKKKHEGDAGEQK